MQGWILQVKAIIPRLNGRTTSICSCPYSPRGMSRLRKTVSSWAWVSTSGISSLSLDSPTVSVPGTGFVFCCGMRKDKRSRGANCRHDPAKIRVYPGINETGGVSEWVRQDLLGGKGRLLQRGGHCFDVVVRTGCGVGVRNCNGGRK